jgi:hypothetical protein
MERVSWCRKMRWSEDELRFWWSMAVETKLGMHHTSSLHDPNMDVSAP